jgi:hypothetical protein
MMDEQIEDAVDRLIHRHTEIDYLLIADRAEVVNGKLYLMGGSFDRLQPPNFPFQLMLGIAVGIRVPLSETDDTHRLHVELMRSENERLLEMKADVQTGRPPGAQGMDLLIPMAFNGAVRILGPGTLTLKASVDDREPRRHEIRVTKRAPGQT